MYKIKWWQENNHWTVTVERRIGPVLFHSAGRIVIDQADIAACSRLESKCLSELKYQIQAQGGIA